MEKIYEIDDALPEGVKVENHQADDNGKTLTGITIVLEKNRKPTLEETNTVISILNEQLDSFQIRTNMDRGQFNVTIR